MAQRSLKTYPTYRVEENICKYVSDNDRVSRVYKLITGHSFLKDKQLNLKMGKGWARDLFSREDIQIAE